MRNTIIAVNSGSNPNCAGTVSSQGHHNLISDNNGTCGLTNGANGDIVVLAAPQLKNLGGYGGPTATHALATLSPALDKGDPAPPGSGGTACELNDQRGLPRTIDGD